MNYKILIADDELIIRKGMVKLISSFGLDLDITPQAKNGIEMLETSKIFKPNIIIADINMPMLNGLDAIKQIYEQDKNIAVIIVSGYDKFEYAQQAIDLGVISYILKPFSNETFKDVLIKAIEYCEIKDSTKVALNSALGNISSSHDIIHFINQNYCNSEMRLSLLEEKFSLGRTAIGNYIKCKTGKTLVDYVNFLRIEHSKILLKKDENISINSISEILGFDNQHYFSRVFKQYCGISPSTFRSLNE